MVTTISNCQLRVITVDTCLPSRQASQEYPFESFIAQIISYFTDWFILLFFKYGLIFASIGTFYSREKVRDVFGFVRQSLVSDWQPFQLFETTGQLKDENASLMDLGLVSGKYNSNAK